MIKAIIFDLDGVLVHTDKLHFLSWKKFTDKLGIYFDETINNSMLGLSRADSLNVVLERSDVKYTEQEKLALAEEKNQIYRQYLSTMSPADVSKEVTDTLSALKNKGLKIAVGSSSKNALLILKQVELLQFFDAVADGTEIARGKPDPEVFLKAASKLNVAPENCLVVEDAEAGVQAALRGGMTAAAVGQAASCGKAHFNLQTFSQLLSVVDKLNCE